MMLTWQCMFSPRLYKIYSNGSLYNTHKMSITEAISDKILLWTSTITRLSLYTTPFIAMFIYKRDFMTVNELKILASIFGGFGCFIAFTILLRGCARACNPKYVKFVKDLKTPVTDRKAYMETVRQYDFDFSAWPVTYTVTSNEKTLSYMQKNPFSSCANADLPIIQRTIIQILAYMAVHTFGIRLIYPGTLFLIQNLVWELLQTSRAQMFHQHAGQRAKLITADGNSIDSMFLDKRSLSLKGKTLVICCEGNGGFFEIGTMTTPAVLGYSTLGWNHPGFASSTGRPFPPQEINAIDAVMQYAINELGFKPSEIVMSGWSIGGFPATWAAANYHVKGLILDATFDDLLPLAENQMPSSWSRLVKEAIRSYVDLNIAELIRRYDGPVQLIRRTEDEIICTVPGKLSTNRGNFLLVALLESRHPEAVEAVSKATLSKYVTLLESQRAAYLTKDLDQPDRALLRLITKYARDYMSNHCSPLPDERFQSAINSFESIKKD